jgi:two-component system sensor histidine kinase KdpD
MTAGRISTAEERESEPGKPASGVCKVPLRTSSAAFAVHDAKNLLATILANLQFMAEALEGAPAEIRDAVEDTWGCSQRMQALLGDALEATRATSGLNARFALAPVGEIVNTAVDNMRRYADGLGVTIWTQLACDGLAVVDAGLVLRLLENLLDNAIRMSPTGTTVLVTGEVRADGVTISVSDEGPGVPEEMLSRIFEPFVSSQSPDSGTHNVGLGLAFCESVARAHGGTLSVENRPSGGACFCLDLPCK